MTRALARSALPTLVALIGLIVFTRVVSAHDDPRAWLAWRYLIIEGFAVLFAASALSVGYRLFSWLRLRGGGLRERLVSSFALGVVAWAMVVVVLGLLHLLGGTVFFMVPLLFLVAGASPLVRDVRRAMRLKRHLTSTGAGLGERALWVVGTVAMLAVWLPTLTARNVSYDAAWYHLPLAEQYAAVGAVFRLDDGFFNGTMPHLASYLYTWAFLNPFGKPFDFVVLASQVEVVLFVATLASLPVLIDRLVPRPRLRASWVGFFLFPGVLLYDSSLVCGADHVLAFWAVPMVLAVRRLWRRPTDGSALLAGAFMGAAFATKYQAAMALVGPAVALGFRFVWSLARPERRRFVRCFGLAVVAALLTSAPHWLLNSVWHHNPLYPHLSSVFPSTPLVEGISPAVTDKAFVPSGTRWERTTETLASVVRFGFESHDWDTFHGKRPVFGSLFLIALALVPFVRRRKPTLAVGAATLLAVPVWYVTQHQDRYLQALAPWAAAVVVSVFSQAWRSHALARPVLALLVAFQIIHTADLWALPSHALLHVNPIREVMEMVASDRSDAPDDALERQFAFVKARTLLPPTAKVLLHDLHMQLGLGRLTLRDNVQRQGAFSWAYEGSTERVRALLASHGVTHLAFTANPTGLSAIGDDLVFYRLVQQSQPGTSLGDGSVLAPLEPSRASVATRHLVIVCGVEQLSPSELNAKWEALYFGACPQPALPDDLDQQIAASEVVVVDSRKHPSAFPRLQAEFTLLFDRYGFKVWGRK